MVSALTRKKCLAIQLPLAERPGAEEDEGPFLQVTKGPNYNGRYDVDTTGIVFWRGDTRAPEEVFSTGFSSRYVRDHNEREIVWRAAIDDIVPESAVCLARDIRGAAFFPYPDPNSEVVDDVNYIYAMTVTRAASTYAIQQVAERVETEKTEEDDWRDPGRFKYDPTWENEDASCVWQFGEYAVHEVPANRIVAGWRCSRRILVRQQDDERVQAGIQFKLDQKVVNNASHHHDVLQKAKDIASTYARYYPRKLNEYLSYFGLVRAYMMPIPSVDRAARCVEQIRPIVTHSDADWSVRDDDSDAPPGIRLRA